MKNSNDLIERVCPSCGKVYLADPVRLKHGRQQACSRKCSYEIVSKKLQKQILLHCAICGKDVWKAPSQIERVKHGSFFCSRECHYVGRSTGVIKHVVTKPYEYTSESKASLIASSSKPKGKRSWHMLTCLNCQKQFDDPRDGRKRKSGMTFCSLDCCNVYRKGENNPSWRGGYDKYYGEDWRGLRRAARKRDDYTCRRCGKDMKPPHRAPDVHHIRPVSSFENKNDANTLDNVLCLCHVCHMLVEWHGLDFAV